MWINGLDIFLVIKYEWFIKGRELGMERKDIRSKDGDSLFRYIYVYVYSICE